MFELASAMFSIADANEFRFARFYIVCEAVALGALKSPLIVCGLSDTHRRVQTWKRHGIRCKPPAGRNTLIFFQIIVSYAVPAEIYMLCFLAYYLSLQNSLPSKVPAPFWTPIRKIMRSCPFSGTFSSLGVSSNASNVSIMSTTFALLPMCPIRITCPLGSQTILPA